MSKAGGIDLDGLGSSTTNWNYSNLTVPSSLPLTTSVYPVLPSKVYAMGDNTLIYYDYNYFTTDSKEYRQITYSKMLAEEGHLVLEDRETLNKMLESKDEDTVKLAVELVKNKTKWLGCYLEALWVIKHPGLQQQILSLYNESKHGKL